MRFEYAITEYVRGNRDNYVDLDIPDNELEDLARKCEDREEFEDKLRDWLYDCEWTNVADIEDDLDTDDSEHSDKFYDCITEACDRFFGDDTTDDVDSRRRRRL